ncbi:MAG: NUDIX hydrolase [Planctomycetaceae bacterium]
MASKPKVLGEGRFLRLVDDGGCEFVERSRGTGVVAIIAVTDDGRVLLTEQFRPAVQAAVIDLPAGLAGDTDAFNGEDLSTAAARELEEETGYAAQTWTRLATVPTSPGLTSETVMLYLAEQVSRVGAGGGDAGEAITVHAVSLARIVTWLQQQQSNASKLIDPKVFAALWLWEHRLNQWVS